MEVTLRGSTLMDPTDPTDPRDPKEPISGEINERKKIYNDIPMKLHQLVLFNFGWRQELHSLSPIALQPL